MIIKGIETCWWLIIFDKTYFRYVFDGFYYVSLNIPRTHGYETYLAQYYVNLSCYFVFTTTLTYVVYWQAHFDANCCNIHTTGIGSVPKAQKNLTGMNYSYRNYTGICGRGHVSAIIINSDNREKQWKKIIQHNSDDAAVVTLETHTLMEINKCRLLTLRLPD